MSCPFSSGSSKAKAGQVCPVTGKSQIEEGEDDEIPFGCYISRSGGLDFNIYNHLDTDYEIPLKNIPPYLTLRSIKDLLKASSAVKIPPEHNWDDVYFCKYDCVIPLNEDQPMELLVKSGESLDMIDASIVKPLFIKVTLPDGKPIGLNYVPPWTTVTQLRKILSAHTTLPLDDYECFVDSNNYVVRADKSGISSVDHDTPVANNACGDTVLDEGVHLGSLGNLLEIRIRKGLRV